MGKVTLRCACSDYGKYRNLIKPENGTFAEYLVAKGDVQTKVPDNLSDEEAATLGVSISTVVCWIRHTPLAGLD